MPVKRVNYMGVPLVIEYEKGDWRKDDNSPIGGMGWPLYADYGYIEGTYTGADNEEWDVFLGPDTTSEIVYILPIHVSEYAATIPFAEARSNESRLPVFDEMKFLFGFTDRRMAVEFAKTQYNDMMIGGDLLEQMTVEEFKIVIEQNEPMAEKMEREDNEEITPAPTGNEAEESELYLIMRPNDLVD